MIAAHQRTAANMKNYYRVMLGEQSAFAEQCFAGNFIGTDFEIAQDLTGKLPDEMRLFNKEFIPVLIAVRPDRSKVSAGLACGALWKVSKGIKRRETVLCPDGKGFYRAGEVSGDYTYQPGEILPHRRPVRWLGKVIDREAMSAELKKSAGSLNTVCDLTDHHVEIERLLGDLSAPVAVPADATVEDPGAFAMEKHLEEFLVENWAQTELGKEFDIYEVDGVRVGQQFETDTGRLDILAISKDRKTLLVVELKKGRASDAVVGQALRYMGYVQEVLAEAGQSIRGVIIALEDDQRIRRALAMVPSIVFYRYEVTFKLVKA